MINLTSPRAQWGTAPQHNSRHMNYHRVDFRLCFNKTQSNPLFSKIKKLVLDTESVPIENYWGWQISDKLGFKEKPSPTQAVSSQRSAQTAEGRASAILPPLLLCSFSQPDGSPCPETAQTQPLLQTKHPWAAFQRKGQNYWRMTLETHFTSVSKAVGTI